VSRRGLPTTVRMRHDEHYVEALAASASSPIGRLLPIDQLDPNPNQPRQVMGDLSELVASIDADRRQGNLSSAIRLYVLDHFRAQSGARTEGRDTGERLMSALHAE